MIVIAHRGASTCAPENTFAAFDLALEMGVHHIELDIDFSSDGHLIVMHDDAVDRTTNGTGLVTEHSLAELKELDAGSWFGEQFTGARIPTYPELLDRYRGKFHFHSEIKGRSPSLAGRIADAVRSRGMEGEVTITSFQEARLREMRGSAPELLTGWLVAEADEQTIARARELGVQQLCPRADTMTPELVQRLHEEGFVARAWGVANEELMVQAVEAGADGMTVNFPDKLISYLESNGIEWD